MNAASPVTSASTPVEVAEDLGHDLVADLAHDLAVALVVLAAGHDVRQERHGAVGGRLVLHRRMQAVDREQPLGQLVDGRLRRAARPPG